MAVCVVNYITKCVDLWTLGLQGQQITAHHRDPVLDTVSGYMLDYVCVYVCAYACVCGSS